MAAKALITGATGFVGSHLARALVEQGWEVHALIRAGSDVSVLDPVVSRLRVHRLPDVRALTEAVEAASGGVIFHLATDYSTVSNTLEAVRLVESNIGLGTQVMCEAARSGHPLFFVNTGTPSQHLGDADYDPVNLYAATKQAFEAILTYYARAHGARCVTLKLADTYGHNDRRRDKVLQLIDRHARQGIPLDMSPGHQLLDLVHVDDVVAAYLLAASWLKSEAYTAGRDFFVRSGRAYTLRDIVAKYEQICGRRVPVRWGGRSYRAREMMQPWSRGAALPGWQPSIALEEGLTRMFVRQ
jgi:nucleoside-diphosphate-sugar epimerase